MNEETNLIEKIRNLGKNPSMPNEKKFLQNLRIKLSDHISAYSAINENIKIPWYSKFSFANALVVPHLIMMPQKTMVVVFVVCLFSLGGIALASQSSLPGDTLYPIKILSEEVQSSLALTPESKVIMHSSFAAKRVEEVKAIMEEKDIDQKELDAALANFQKNTANAAAIVDEESKKGKDTAKLAKDTRDTIGKNTDNLNQIFNNKNSDLKKEENSLQNKIEEAKKTNDQASVASLNTQLNETNNKRKSLEANWNENEKILSENAQKIKKQTEEKQSQNSDEAQLQKKDLQNEKNNPEIKPSPESTRSVNNKNGSNIKEKRDPKESD